MSIYTDVWMILVAVLKQTNPDAGKVDKYPPEIPYAKVEFYKDGKRYSIIASWNHGWSVKTSVDGEMIDVQRYNVESGQEALLKAMSIYE